MSNKKLFCVVFFSLSCFEFGHFVYSKTKPVNIPQNMPYQSVLHSHEIQALGSECVFNTRLASNLLPR
ncbi:MAG: hypothetical protein ACI9UT_000040 [Flavobacteriales bacterium]|jgi:hypothetical protein